MKAESSLFEMYTCTADEARDVSNNCLFKIIQIFLTFKHSSSFKKLQQRITKHMYTFDQEVFACVCVCVCMRACPRCSLLMADMVLVLWYG